MVDALCATPGGSASEVCAEGIESLEDLQALADLDVTYGQGFVLSVPAPLGRRSPGRPWRCAAPRSAQ